MLPLLIIVRRGIFMRTKSGQSIIMLRTYIKDGRCMACSTGRRKKKERNMKARYLKKIF
jgi:hypothetical protein